jgi:hypothetical protein
MDAEGGPLRAVFDGLRALAEELLDVARASPPGGGEAFFALLARWGIEPLSEAERRRALLSGLPFAGALPIEVRRALEHLAREVHRSQVEVAQGSQARLVLELELAAFVEQALRTYLEMIGPPSRRTSHIFQNALRTTTRYEPTAASVSSTRCQVCSAARIDAASACGFCGASFFGKVES